MLMRVVCCWSSRDGEKALVMMDELSPLVSWYQAEEMFMEITRCYELEAGMMPDDLEVTFQVAEVAFNPDLSEQDREDWVKESQIPRWCQRGAKPKSRGGNRRKK